MASIVNKNPNYFEKLVENYSAPYQKNGMLPEGNLLPRKFDRMNSLQNSYHRNQNNYRNADASELEEIEEFFNKKFSYKQPESGWHLPEPNKMFVSERWKLEEMMRKKKNLNHVKNKLNDFDLELWHKHTRSMNKATNVMRTVRNDLNAELVTQAWCKFYEICGSYQFISKTSIEDNYLNSLHICEAPGAFIASLNHYIKLNHPEMKWEWIATTLNPYYEGNPLPKMINDDKFILHTLDRWDFGEDYTGNLMDLENLRHLAKECQKLGPILMITADGSIDCMSDPGEQESIVSQLIFCEVVAALHILSLDGNFVVKMFTMYEAETICLMYLLVCSFASVNVYKPATSKEGNSEVYVVCLGYKGVNELKPWLQILNKKYCDTKSIEVMFSLDDIPKDFIKQHEECTEKFKYYQTEVIERNIFLFNLANHQPSLKKMRRMSVLVADEYIKRYRLKCIQKEEQIVGVDILKMTKSPNIDSKESLGTFNDLLQKQKVQGIDKLQTLLLDVTRTPINWEFEEDIKWLKFENYSNNFNIVIGKSVTSVHCSKFCSGKVLTLRNEIAKFANEIGCSNQATEPGDSQSGSYSKELSPEIKKIIERCRPGLLKKLNVINYEEKLWSSLKSGMNESFERSAFMNIMDLMDTMWRDESFVLQGYPMLTQFTVGVIFMISHLFEEVGFVRPNGPDFAVIFQKYQSWNVNMTNFLVVLDNEIEKLDNEKDVSVLAMTPLTDLVNTHKEFYRTVTHVNSLCVHERNLDALNQIKRIFMNEIQ